MKVKSLSRVRLLEIPWTAAYQAPPSMGFSRQESWSGMPLPSPQEKCKLLQMRFPWSRGCSWTSKGKEYSLGLEGSFPLLSWARWVSCLPAPFPLCPVLLPLSADLLVGVS